MSKDKGRGARQWLDSATRDATAHKGRYGAAMFGGIMVFWLVNVWPGWQAVPFLDAATSQVLGIFNASLLVSVAVNLANVTADGVWVRATGEIVTSCAGVAVFARLWTVYPFDFGQSGFDWNTVVRIALVLACAGCLISILAQFATLFRLALGMTPGRHPGQSRNLTGQMGHGNTH
ncbi:MAG: hypothetical protein WBX27_12280 [Specibacter sp.]